MEENAVGVTSQANRSTLTAILLSVSAGLSLVVASIFIFKPYFGNMVDSVHMEMAGQAPF